MKSSRKHDIRINMIANHEIKPNLQFLQSKRSVLHVLLSLIVYIPFPNKVVV